MLCVWESVCLLVADVFAYVDGCGLWCGIAYFMKVRSWVVDG